MSEEDKKKLKAETKFMKHVMDIRKEYEDAGITSNEDCRSIEVRMDGVSYVVPVGSDGTHSDVVSSKEV
eukprot:CAMPEP_0197458488 /NCGR_PEP_ID=MMETSP1175-20131217/48856_1 /TAXON_ID=1003142 /ORGANISM="Triceratium dubium, Strain CCMP147" /LENGTH=68 /DNA_ID=CAMNT_0042993147 /DNA_START=1 /DNA_END=204 /DNA_ORIENTATION=-